MKVLKFGGSSVANSSSINKVISVLSGRTDVRAVIFSAFGGVTDSLLGLIRDTCSGQIDRATIADAVESLKQRHSQVATDFQISKDCDFIDPLFSDIEDQLAALLVLKEETGKTTDRIISCGELLSAQLMTLILKESGIETHFVDSRELISTDNKFGNASVDSARTYEQISKSLASTSGVAILPGFIGTTAGGETTTLGRGGSDYTAALVAAALSTDLLEIWTDVPGMLTADPAKVQDAFVIEEMLFEEAMELCHFGAKVLYPPTLSPVREKNIPIHIKDTFRSEMLGTKILPEISHKRRTITGITSLQNTALVTLQGSGLVGVTGSARRLFAALSAEEINVILISQASSEHSICFAIDEVQIDRAKRAVESEFQLEIETGRIDPLIIDCDIATLSVVGQEMRHSPGVASAVFQSLASSRINVIAIAQGSSERNISFVVPLQDEKAALNAIHRKFFMDLRRVHLFLLGPGQVGKALLTQLAEQYELLRENHRLEIRLIGLANSRNLYLSPEGIDMGQAPFILEQNGSSYSSPDVLLETLLETHLSHTVVVDCTASDELSELYKKLLKNRIPIITSNKKVQTASQKTFQELLKISRENEVPIRFETSVGAALPVISTLREILVTGDRVRKIEATLSGTLSYLFNAFMEGKDFSTLVREAQDLGYTEPDPREDLSGLDVARKLLILIRSSGFPMELQDIQLSPMLPDSCMEAGSIEEFYALLPSSTDEITGLRDEAALAGNRLHYIAAYDGENATVSLKTIESDSPFHGLRGTDNMIAFYTDRYPEHPLVIRGAGAGPEVTASGVFSDLIRVVQRRGIY